MIVQTSQLDPAHAVLESHKIFVKALKTIEGDTSNAASVITKFRHRFKQERMVWFVHNLRNRVAHDMGVEVSERMAQDVRKTLVKALENLSK